MPQRHHLERALVSAPRAIVHIVQPSVVALIAVLFFLRLADVGRGQVEDLAGELGALLQPLLLLALGETLLRLVPLPSLSKLIVIDDFGESVLPLVLGLYKYISVIKIIELFIRAGGDACESHVFPMRCVRHRHVMSHNTCRADSAG